MVYLWEEWVCFDSQVGCHWRILISDLMTLTTRFSFKMPEQIQPDQYNIRLFCVQPEKRNRYRIVTCCKSNNSLIQNNDTEVRLSNKISTMFDDSMDEAFIIRQANEIKDFVSVFKLQDQAGTTSQVIYSSSLSLNNTQKAAIFGILQSNMQSIYEATSWGWDESQKRKELFAQNSRFLLLVEPDNPDNIKAFVMFRFEWDDEDEPEHPVLFCYELQVQSACHKQGLGKTLMKMLQSIAEHCRFWKTMLTCFKINENALRFYHTIGFDVDLNSPSCYGHHDEPYEILSDKPKLR